MPSFDEVFGNTEEPEAAPKENWGKLPKAHYNRFYYKEVGNPPHLVLMYNTDPDLEGELTRPEPPPPPPTPKVEFTEPMAITGSPKQSTIPPPMQGYGQFTMPVQPAKPENQNYR